jgi:hypothetical protein
LYKENSSFINTEQPTLRHLLTYLHTGLQNEGNSEARPPSLASHSTRATDSLPFRKETTKALHSTYLGVELELEGYGEDSNPHLELIKNHAIFKRDGSLSNGVEICTAPSTLGIHKEAFKPFFDSLTETSRLAATTSCGMHVHVDKRTMSTLHIANLHIFMNTDTNEEAIVNIAGRPQNQFCRVAQASYYDFTEGRSLRDRNRYARINHQNQNTIEFRLFASTTSFEDFCKRLEFTQAVVDYTLPMSAGIPVSEIPKWDNFKSFVETRRKQYPTLSKGF